MRSIQYLVSHLFIKKMLKYLELSQSINHPKRRQNLYPQLKIATYINVCFKSTVFLWLFPEINSSLPSRWSYFVALSKENETKGKYCDGNYSSAGGALSISTRAVPSDATLGPRFSLVAEISTTQPHWGQKCYQINAPPQQQPSTSEWWLSLCRYLSILAPGEVTLKLASSTAPEFCSGIMFQWTTLLDDATIMGWVPPPSPSLLVFLGIIFQINWLHLHPCLSTTASGRSQR